MDPLQDLDENPDSIDMDVKEAAENDRDEGDSVVPLCAQEKSADGNLRIFLRYPSYSLDIVNEFAQLQTTEKMDLSPQLPDYVDEEVNPKVTRNGFLFVAVENDDEQFSRLQSCIAQLSRETCRKDPQNRLRPG